MWQQARLKGLVCLLFYSSIALNSVPTAFAQQVSHQRLHNEALNQYELNYQWRDQNNTLRNLNFTLQQPGSEGLFDSLRQLSPQRINRSLIRPLSQYARAQGWHQLEVSLASQQSAIIYEPNLRNSKTAQKRTALMREREQIERQLLLEKHYLTFLNVPPNQYGVAPDHPRIALASSSAVAPVSRAFYDSLGGSSPRQYVDVITSFIQSIPYSPLTNRLEAGGKGFSPPAQLLIENRGDCDSKVTLAAAVLRNLMPNISMAVVYLPNHALLAIAINALDDDTTIEHQGVKLVVLELAGPTQLSVGKLTDTSALHVLNGNITVKSI